MPFRIALAGRKAQDFEEVSIGIAEVERLDAAGAGIPIRQALRLGRGVGDAVCAQMRIRAIHVAYDDGDVLEPAIVAARIRGNRAPLWREVFGQLQALVTEAQTDDAHARTEDA